MQDILDETLIAINKSPQIISLKKFSVTNQNEPTTGTRRELLFPEWERQHSQSKWREKVEKKKPIGLQGLPWQEMDEWSLFEANRWLVII